MAYSLSRQKTTKRKGPDYRVITYRIRQKEGYMYEKSAWRYPFFGGYKFESHLGAA